MKKAQNTRSVPFRRKREGRTDYKKRLAMLKSGKARLVVRKTLKNIYAQIIKYDAKGDIIIASACSEQLRKLGWKMNASNVSAAYLVGYMVGKNAQEKKVSEAILDLGLQTTFGKSKLYAVLKGAVDAGLKVPYSDKVLPSQDRIEGKHIEIYANLLKEDKVKYEKQFSKYLKQNVKPEEASKHFEEIKKKL